jgi:TPP-dependent pyruvate/acetoin dehydrogenase alpha subunit
VPELSGEEELDVRFVSAVRDLQGCVASVAAGAPVAARTALTGEQLIALFDAQAGSRHLDLAARYLRAEGHGFYTIGSAGHEADAAVGAALRPSDPALLHYRSGAFYLARAAQVPAAVAYVRATRSLAFLHLKVVRFLGHAGSDAEVGYRSQAEVAAEYARDPLLGTARLIVAAACSPPSRSLAGTRPCGPGSARSPTRP